MTHNAAPFWRIFPAVSLPQYGAIIFAFSLLLALLAQLSFAVPFSPVPVTGQTLGVLLAGFVLGARGGAAVIALYLAQGLAGLPVFAGGLSGPAAFIGPSGGYLLGFLPAAWLAGWLAEKRCTDALSTMIPAAVLAHLPLYAAGLLWLNFYLATPAPAVLLAAGLWPFLAGDTLKILFAAVLLPVISKKD